MANEKHEFALFFPELALKGESIDDNEFPLRDSLLVHRLGTVLRLEPGTIFVLFDEQVAATVELLWINKKEVRVRLLSLNKHKLFVPAIHWYVPLIERDALETIVGALTVMGSASITFVETEKSRSRLVLSSDRIKRLMIAAAEQSKQFNLPMIESSIGTLEKVIEHYDDKKTLLFFDPQGTPALTIVSMLAQKRLQEFSCLVGPEGDLTEHEKRKLKERNVHFCALTPSVLRAEIAVMVAMGMLRSCVQ